MDFRLLGPVAVHDGNTERGIPARRQRSIFALLLLNAGRMVPAAQLVEEIWAGDPPNSAETTLHTYMMRLRQSVGQPVAARIRTHSPGYVIDLDSDELDAERFRSLRLAGWQAAQRRDHGTAADRLAEALAQWRGEPLADLPELADRQADVTILREQRVQTLEWRYESELALGHHAGILPEIRQSAVEHPLRERFLSQLMIALYRCDRRADALAVFRQARTCLVEQLGIEPGEELSRTHQQILEFGVPAPAAAADSDSGAHSALASAPISAAPAASATAATASAFVAGTASEAPAAAVGPAAPARPRQLPADAVWFVGRDPEIQAAQRTLCPGAEPDQCPVVAVTGPGGMGKSTLAIRAARQVAPAFPDGQLFANLRGSSLKARPVHEVLGRFLRDLGVEESAIPADEDDRAALYRSTLADRRVLVLVDDAHDVASLRRLIPGTGGCALLATSRNRLSALPATCRIELDVLAPPAAAQLFARIAGPGHGQADPEAVARVLRFCAGSPLAIQIAATRLAASPALTAGALARHLADWRRRVDELEIDDLSIRAVLAGSREQLNPDQTRVFDLLGALLGRDECGELGLEAAGRLLDLPAAEAARALDQLCAVHLLEAIRPGRYRYHDLVKPYALESAHRAEPAAVREATRRLTRWVLGAVTAANAVVAPERQPVPADSSLAPDPFRFADRGEALDWFEENRECVTACIGQAHEAGFDGAAWRIAVASWSMFTTRDYAHDLVFLSGPAVLAARATGERAGIAWVLNGLGGALYDLGRFDEAEAAWTEVLEIRVATGDDAGAGITLNNLGAMAVQRGRAAEGVARFRESLLAHGRAQHGPGIAMALNNLGEAYLAQGAYDEALEVLQKSLTLRRSLGIRRGEGLTTQTLGKVHAAMDRPGQARSSLLDALAILREVGDLQFEAETLALLEAI